MDFTTPVLVNDFICVFNAMCGDGNKNGFLLTLPYLYYYKILTEAEYRTIKQYIDKRCK